MHWNAPGSSRRAHAGGTAHISKLKTIEMLPSMDSVSNDARILRAQRRFVNANERFVSERVAAGDV